MLTASYPRLGSKVSYIRQLAQTGELQEGVAVILAIHLDQSKRLAAHLEGTKEDGSKELFNVDLNLLDPSAETKAALQVMADQVKALSEEGNGKAAAVISEFNAKIEMVVSQVMGEPVMFEAL